MQGRWVDFVAYVYIIVALSWHLAPLDRTARFSAKAAVRTLWLFCTAFALAFWPLGIAVWFNGWNVQSRYPREVVITAINTTRAPRAVTAIQTYALQERRGSWTGDMQVSPDHRQTLAIGDCATVFIQRGRLGLDWIDGAKPHPCS